MRLVDQVVRFALVTAAAAAIGGWPTNPAVAFAPSAQQVLPAQPTAAGASAPEPSTLRSVTAAPGRDATLTIRTLPPLPGIRLSLDDTTVTTNEAGIATVTQQRNTGTHTLTLLDAALETPDRRYAFSRWVGQRDPEQAFTPTLGDLPMRGDSTVTATFSVQYAVTAQFVDQGGIVIDPAMVTSATVRSDTGAVLPIATAGPTWLEAIRPSRGNKYEVENVSYSWQSMTISGTNVVDAGRQSFTPAQTPDVTVVGQFHDLTVVGYDALLGHGAGEQAVLTLPDGTVRAAPLDGDHGVVFPHLPRGTYQVTITAGASIVGDHQVRLSRDVTLRAPVISAVDIAILAGSLVLVAVGLVIIGRRHLARRLVAPFRPEALAEVEVR